jgi:hypothetical protein
MKSRIAILLRNLIRHAFSARDAQLTGDRASSVRSLRVISVAHTNTEL